jgi:hypothetical protein
VRPVKTAKLVEDGIRWTLATWMLLATPITSSTYVHSHNGGCATHRHDGCECASSNSSSPTAHHDDCAASANLFARDTHRHGCLVWFGTITSHSTPDNSSGPHGKNPCDWETIVAVSAAQTIRAPSKNLLGSHFGLASQAVLATGCVCELKRLEPSCTGTAPVSPLCDRARHERSGVLLA